MRGHLNHVAVVYCLQLVIFSNGESCTPTTPCTPLKGSLPFEEPVFARSENGILVTRLVVDIGTKQIDWLTVQRRLYNGTFPGPTIIVKAGDRVNLTLINNLKDPDYQAPEPDVMQYPNSTNLHTHGLHISSVKPQDNVLDIDVLPNEEYLYQYEIDPEQPAGTYWYHPHRHGAGFFQVSGGMSGMLIVEDDPNTMSKELNAVSCPQNCIHDLQMVFQMFQYSTVEEGGFTDAQDEIHDSGQFRLNETVNNSTETLDEWLKNPENNISYILVNGLLQPNVTVEPGQSKRLRLLSAGGLYALALRIVSTDPSIDDFVVKEIALDGIYLDQPRDLRLGRSLIVAGSRIDWVVKFPTSGTYELQSYFVPKDTKSMGSHPKFTGVLATIVVSGTSTTQSNLPTELPKLPSFLPDFLNVDEKDIGGRFAVEVTPTDTINREDFTKSIRYKMEVGTIQELYFTNTEFQTSHPIHMHINTFQVISYNTYTGPYGVDDGGSNWALYSQNGSICSWQHSNYDVNAQITPPRYPLEYLGHEDLQAGQGEGTIGYAQIGERRDTILVPPLGNITVRFMTDTYTGEVVIHCHLLKDSDQGMLMVVEIVEKGQSLEANITSAGAYPWSCFENYPITYEGSSAITVSSAGQLLMYLSCVLVFIFLR